MSAADERRLETLMASVTSDPLAFVMVSFPWGEPGELENHSGPDAWQVKVLNEIRDGLKVTDQVIREAVAAGNGVGKSALVAWLILWGMATRSDTRITVTANTENQLRTKTWPELSRWHRLFIARHWFRLTATGLFSVDPQHELGWRADAVPWSETNPDAFSGLHNHGKRLIVIMDEASSIADVIWERVEGALTDVGTQILWLVFGNPTMNTGRFRECFDRLSHRWNRHQIDSRTVKMSNKRQLAEWEADYSSDDDWFRVHVRGLFPHFGTRQFIGLDLVRSAASPARQAEFSVYDPLICGVDVARFGDNETVIRFRRGLDARLIPPTRVRGMDTMQVAQRVVDLFEEHRPDAIFVDAGGVGAGVMDRLRMLRLPAIDVQFGARAASNRDMGQGRNNYYNQRSMMYGLMRDWLTYGLIDEDKKLMEGLSAPNYSYRTVDGTDSILLEKKEDIRRRLGDVALDDADSLALTFAFPVQKSDHTKVIAGRGRQSGFEAEYAPMQAAWNIPGPGQGTQAQSWMPGGVSPWSVR